MIWKKIINDEFDTTLINRIKSEINLALESKNIATNKTDDEQRLNANHISNANHLKNNDILINTLQSEIKFLREEVASKITIIEIMLNRKPLNDTIKKNLNDGSSSSEIQINNIEVNDNDTSKVINEDMKNYNMVKNKKSNKKRSMCILSDSMTKDIDTHKIRRELLNKSDRLYIKSFNGDTTADMNSYVLPAKRHKNDLYVLHTGTNDLRSGKDAEEICNNIIN